MFVALSEEVRLPGQEAESLHLTTADSGCHGLVFHAAWPLNDFFFSVKIVKVTSNLGRQLHMAL